MKKGIDVITQKSLQKRRLRQRLYLKKRGSRLKKYARRR